MVDGQNITIEYRWAAGQYDRLSEMAADLVRREAAVIAVNTPAVMPAKKATSTIPIQCYLLALTRSSSRVVFATRVAALAQVSFLQSGPPQIDPVVADLVLLMMARP